MESVGSQNTGQLSRPRRLVNGQCRLLAWRPFNNLMAAPKTHFSADRVPLCVDLDGTLIRTDTMWEAMVWLLKHNPLNPPPTGTG